MNNMTFNDKINIRNKIDKLSLESKLEISKIIKNSNTKHNKTAKHMLIDLKNCSDETLNEIIKFLDYNDENNRKLLEDELERDNYKNIISN